MKNYLKQYYNKTSTDKFIIGKDIQAVTGATITANAINEIIFNQKCKQIHISKTDYICPIIFTKKRASKNIFVSYNIYQH